MSSIQISAMSDLSKRVITALLISIIAVPIIFYGGPLAVSLLLVIYGFALFEFFSKTLILSRLHLFVLTLLYYIFPVSFLLGGLESFFAVFMTMIVVLAGLLVYYVEQLEHQPDIHALYFGLVSSLMYPTLPLLGLLVISSQYDGQYLLWVVVSVVTADTLAYFVGKLAGGKALSPRISPKKSWSGSIAGVIGASLASLAWGISFEFQEPVLRLIALGLLIGILAVLGDLFESMMKRAIGTKDMGSLLPGHGGVLDRIDALLFAAPVIFLL